MKVLIVGVTSAMGRLLAQDLMARGHRVSGIDYPLPAPQWPEGVKSWQGDIRRSIVAEALREERPDTVVHWGTQSPFGKRAKNRTSINLQGTRNLLDGVIKYGVRNVLFVSSHAYYGAGPELPLCRREDDPPYAVETFPELADFVAAELLTAATLAMSPGTSFSVLRLCHPLGPTGRGVLARLLRGHRVPSVMGFDPVVQFMHEEDLIRAVRESIEQRLAGTYNIGGDNPLALSAIVQKTGRILTPLPEALYRLSLGPFGLSEIPSGAISQFKYPIVVDDSLFRNRTGFRPNYDETSVLAKFVEAFPI
jgi:UDP-glucose 4-epimerase